MNALPRALRRRLPAAIGAALVASAAPVASVTLTYSTAKAASAAAPLVDHAKVTAISNSVDADFPWAVATLEKLVNENSGTQNLAGVTKVGTMMRAELEGLGFNVSWVPMAATHRAGHLIATHRGTAGRKRILLIGHLDTVFEPDSGFLRFVRKGDLASGPGASDDKGGMVVMLCALRALRNAHALDALNIEIVLTGDEEAPGAPLAQARADLIAAGHRADAALDFEGLITRNGHDMGSVSRRSAQSYVITAHGRSGHSSGIFSAPTGDGAVFELARILSQFRSELPEPKLTFSIGLMGGGSEAQLSDGDSHLAATGKDNIVPGIAVASGDYRAVSLEQDARVRTRMQAIVARHLPGTTAEIRFRDGYPPMTPTAGNRALLAKLNAINSELGLEAMTELDPLLRGAGDISFVAGSVDSLAGLGTVSSGDHTPRETVELTSIRRQAKRAALLMVALGAETAPRH